MKLLYISPHYPSHYSRFAERLAARGVEVLGITDQYDHQLNPALRRALRGHYRVDGFHATDQVFSACEFFRREFGPFDRVESHLESWVELEAEIRERFSVKGPKLNELKFLKRKSRMKEIFQKARVPTARGMVADSLEGCRSFIGGKYPVFIKPDTGVGAADTYTIQSESDLLSFFAHKGNYPYFMEEYLSGVIESFDGLTDQEGEVVFFTSHVFSNDIHKVVKQNENLYYYSQRTLPADLETMGHRVVRSAGIREKFFHIEFFRLPSGELKGLELNVRPPGGLTTEMFNFACDIDVYDWWAAILAGEESRSPYERKYHCAFVSRKFNRPYRHSHDDLERDLGPALVHHQPMNLVEFAVMGNHGYLVRSADLDELKRMIRAVVQEGP